MLYDTINYDSLSSNVLIVMTGEYGPSATVKADTDTK